MGTYISLLRGINVGGHRKLPMAELRELAEALGWGDVRSYIQSGNLVFTHRAAKTEKLSRELTKAIEERFGFDVPVVTRTRGEWEKAIEANPFIERGDCDPGQLSIVFLSSNPQRDGLTKLEARDLRNDEFQLIGREIFLHCPDGAANARISITDFERALGASATARNLRTVGKLREMAAEL